MNYAFDPLNLIILAIAVVIFLRLRSLLGRRTGNERRRVDPYTEAGKQRPAGAGQDGKVIPLPDRRAEEAGPVPAAQPPRAPVWEGFAEAGSKLARALEDIARADAGFSPKQFLDGARLAYEMIVTAFAEGDRRALKNLLSSEVYEGFTRALDEREQRGEKLESNFIGIEKANIADAALEGRKASVTVRFVSQLITATRNRDGAVVDGDPKRVREVTDIWTFIRDVTFSDPNWRLGATESAA